MNRWSLAFIAGLLLNGSVASADLVSEVLEKNEGQVVLLDFWASWCGPCKKSFPWMNEMHEKYSAKGLKIIAVNLDKEKALAEKFLVEYPARFEIQYDSSGKSAEKMNVQAMPSAYLYDINGKGRFRHLGFELKKKSQYESEIAQLLGEKK